MRHFSQQIFYAVASLSQNTVKEPKHRIPTELSQSLGPYSPYFAAGEYTLPQPGCDITQVHLLQRHGARSPTEGAYAGVENAVRKLQRATILDESLKFVQSYDVSTTIRNGIGELLNYGLQEAHYSGWHFGERYPHLVASQPFVRASGSKRVVDSALQWQTGFDSSRKGQKLGAPLIFPENTPNNTLHNYCPADNGTLANFHTSSWAKKAFGSAARRFERLAPGSNLSTDDLPFLISLCSFDSLARDTESPWCSPYTKSEFQAFEYWHGLSKYYSNGFVFNASVAELNSDGNPLGPSQGIGYIKELIARLTARTVEVGPQINSTLDLNDSTFPLARQIYADFSHDNQMISILSALGIFNKTLSSPATNSFKVSRIVPFSGRLVTERLQCVDGVYLRMFLNDAAVTFANSPEPRIELTEWVDSQEYARHNGHGQYADCLQDEPSCFASIM